MLKPTSFLALSKIQLAHLLPPDILARKTVFVRQIESFMGEHTGSELNVDIQKPNSRVKIEQLAKVPSRTRMFKMLLEDAHSVVTILHEGFEGFSCRICPSQINPEAQTHLVNCFNLYI